MTNEITALIISEPVYAAIRETIAQTAEGLETGVTLFGARNDGLRTALCAVGPGPRAVHTPGFHKPDIEYVNREYARLRETLPGLEWIGSLHVHPVGMTWLSGHDRSTVDRLLAMHPDRLHLPDFIAGIIQRRQGRFAVYPYLLGPHDPTPWLLPIQIVAEDAASIRDAEQRARIPRLADHSPSAGHSRAGTIMRRAIQACLRVKPFVHRMHWLKRRKNDHDKTE
jgi:hypothetical protein